MGRRTLLLIASILIAGVGTAMIAVYVRNADERAQQGQALVRVYEAIQRIPAGTPGNSVIKFSRPAQRRSADAKGALGALNGIMSQYTVVDILPGQLIVDGQFGAASKIPSNATGLGDDKLAVAITLTASARVAGTLAPGADVAMYANVGGQTTLLYPKIRVLKVAAQAAVPVEAATGAAQNEGVTGDLVTLELEPRQVATVIYASTYQKIVFAVLGPGGPQPPSGTVAGIELGLG